MSLTQESKNLARDIAAAKGLEGSQAKNFERQYVREAKKGIGKLTAQGIDPREYNQTVEKGFEKAKRGGNGAIARF